MGRFNPFRLETFCVISMAVAIWGAVLSTKGVAGLAVIWIGYVLLFAIVNVVRQGLRGLVGPGMVLVAMALIYSSLLPLAIATWCLCALVYFGRWLLRLVWRSHGPAAISRRDKRPKELEPVTISVAMPSVAADAQIILKRFGLMTGATADGF